MVQVAAPDRSYRARLATHQEIKDLHSRGAWPPGWVPDRELLRLAIVKIDSERAGIEVLYPYPAGAEPGAEECELKAMWGNAQISIADIAAGRGSEQCK